MPGGRGLPGKSVYMGPVESESLSEERGFL